MNSTINKIGLGTIMPNVTFSSQLNLYPLYMCYIQMNNLHLI